MAEVEEVVSTPTVEVDEKPKLDNLGRAYSTGKRKKDVVSEIVDHIGTQDFIGFNQVYMTTNFRRDVGKLLN